MQSYLFSDAISMALMNSDYDFEVHNSSYPGDTAELCRLFTPYALLMEVTSYMPWKLEERLAIRNKVKQQVPDCKIVLIVDENSEKMLAREVAQAKKNGLIDNFIYGSVSSAYLSAVIDTL
ncbi:MAG: hypothetical protein PUE85_05165 [Firmicutes bacterium]|nr:hypothetical protein [Bacillota bacterium]